MPVIVTCDHCGENIRKRPSNVRQRNFCNPACYHAGNRGANSHNWQGGKVALVCEQCSKEYTTHKAWLKRGSRFCSTECTRAWIAKHNSGPAHTRWQGGPVTWTCENCGQDFEVSRGIYNSRMPRYCSQKCMGEWRKEHWQGEGHPQWQGLSEEPYDEEWCEGLRMLIRERDGQRCTICGKTEIANGRQLSVHHIDYDKQNSREANLVTLCTEHHISTNGDRQWWRYYLPRFSRGKYVIT